MYEDYDYRSDLENIHEMEEYYEALAFELDLEELQSYTLIARDSNSAIFMNCEGEVRAIGAPYLDKVFN